MAGASASAESQRLTSWRWGALLAFALFAPVTLPAGGADRRSPEVRRRSAGEPLLSTGGVCVQASPDQQAPALAQLQADQPLRVLRSWRNGSGEQWLHVEAAEQRGWLVVA